MTFHQKDKLRQSAVDLAKLMFKRRTRRFARGLTLEAPLQFPERGDSKTHAEDLSEEEEAALAFAAVGITGSVLAELPYHQGTAEDPGSPSAGGNIICNLTGRTVVSPDAAHPTAVFVINDKHTYFLKRPQNFEKGAEIRRLVESMNRLEGNSDAVQRALWKMYRDLRVELNFHGMRPGISEAPPHTPIFNRWASNKRHTTLFIPVMELTEQYLCALFGGLDEQAGYYLLDDRNGLQPSGLKAHARSVGGYLRDDNDNVDESRVFTQDFLDTVVPMFAAVELGAITQNMSLMAHALGVGGWPHYAAGHKWMEALGFDHERIKVSKLLGLPPDLAVLLQASEDDKGIWSPLGLWGTLEEKEEKDSFRETYTKRTFTPKQGNRETADWLVKPFCPPNYPDMETAVEAFVATKYGPEARADGDTSSNEKPGRFRDGGQPSAWRKDPQVRQGIKRYTRREIDAAIDHADYIHERYGRFPAKFGPLVTLTAFQAHRLEEEFYNKHYGPGVLP